MIKLLSFSAALALAFVVTASPVSACEGDKNCECAHGKDKAAATTAGKAEKVSLEGTVVSFGCEMKAKQQACTGAALVVGETKHLIKKAAKGTELVSKAKDSNKTVKVSGTMSGKFLTVSTFEIKG